MLFRSTMSRSVFIRLLALGLFDFLVTFPVAALNLTENIGNGPGLVSFYPGWDIVHPNISTVQTVTAEEWKSSRYWTLLTVKFNEWINPIFALAFFLLFGLSETRCTRCRDLLSKALGLPPRENPEFSSIVFGPNFNTGTRDPEVGITTDISKVLSFPILVDKWAEDRKSTRLNSSHSGESRMPSSA